jgi:hypothetical protein
MNKKIHDMAVFIEFVAGSGLAIFFHLVLHNEDAAYIIFGVGSLLSLATYLLREDISQSREKILDKYDYAHEITFAIARMTDPESQAKAHEIIAGAKNTIALLQQGYIPFDETEFYMKAAKYLDESLHHVKAVNPVTVGWASRGALLNYYQANRRALARGVRITRIFVITRDGLADANVCKVLLPQIRDGIDVRIAYREELPTASDMRGRNTSGSLEFAIYDDQVVAAAFSHPGVYFGRKTSDPALVGNYQRLFAVIEHNSHPVAAEGDRVVLVAERHYPAS